MLVLRVEGADGKPIALAVNFAAHPTMTEAGDLRFPMKPDMMPNGKTDTNNNCAVSTDYIGQNYAYPEASYEERERILHEHESYQKGLMWTLANHPRVPEKIRQQMAAWGLAPDEFTDNGGWPHQIYVREARRMVGTHVMTEHELLKRRPVAEPVGMGSYTIDSHNVQRYITPEGYVQNEGDIGVPTGGPYAIAYGALVSRSGRSCWRYMAGGIWSRNSGALWSRPSRRACCGGQKSCWC